MFAIEFKTKIKNGVITVPRKYRGRLKENVKVVVLSEEEDTSINMIDKLLDTPVKAGSFSPLTREEIYARK